jgi:hypothetical protein
MARGGLHKEGKVQMSRIRRPWVIAVLGSVLAGTLVPSGAGASPSDSSGVTRASIRIPLPEANTPPSLPQLDSDEESDGMDTRQGVDGVSLPPSVEIEGLKYRVVHLPRPDADASRRGLPNVSLGMTPDRLSGCKNEGYYIPDHYRKWEYGGPGDPYDLHVYRYLQANQCSYWYYIGEPLASAMINAHKWPPVTQWMDTSATTCCWKIRINVGLSWFHSRGLLGDLTEIWAANITRVAWSPW